MYRHLEIIRKAQQQLETSQAHLPNDTSAIEEALKRAAKAEMALAALGVVLD